MRDYFQPCLSILPPAQQLLWPLLRPVSQLGFTLYGGTAIALRLGHRVSIDFDFFSDQPLDRDALRVAFPVIAAATVLQEKPDSLTVSVPSGTPAHEGSVKVSFFGSIGFGRVAHPSITRDGVLQVASLQDLMATKIKTLLQRVEAKDYIDIAAMLKAGASLAHGLSSARAMYGQNFQPSESLKALVYFQGGDLDTLSEADKQTLTQAVFVIENLPRVSLISQRLAILPVEEKGDLHKN